MKKTKETMTEPAVPVVAKIAVPENVLAATLEYLATRPFKEVFEIVNAIQTQSEKI
jgi:hypothetical protein